MLYRLLNNRVYIGEAVHKGTSYPGEHDAIIDRDLWDQVHAILKESPRKRANNACAQSPALLRGAPFRTRWRGYVSDPYKKIWSALSLLHPARLG